jgi:hypothetical protein
LLSQSELGAKDPDSNAIQMELEDSQLQVLAGAGERESGEVKLPIFGPLRQATG